MVKRLVLFNPSGGVSNTMPIYNLGWSLAEKYRVLLVDADPKCDLTSLILRDDFDAHYSNERTRRHNLKDGTSAAFVMDPLLIKPIDCPAASRSSNLRVLAGHPNLSDCDLYLTLVQDAGDRLPSIQNTPGAFNRLIELSERKYDIDITLINLAAGLSAINQNLFLHSDYFVVPITLDRFSWLALKKMKYTVSRWLQWKRNTFRELEDAIYALRPGTPKFAGILFHQVDNRIGRTKAPAGHTIDDIKSVVLDDFFPHIRDRGMTLAPEQYSQRCHTNGYVLEEIVDFSGLLAKAIDVGIAPLALTDQDLEDIRHHVPDGSARRDLLRSQFQNLTAALDALMEYA
ncbi:chromosome partitioning protein ParA [Pandoraea captiosa]|uniref:Chromosome partitioning protein ParA n=1 Tax=Pandoraea captiosa TaxID=2508302 RepID=A0A5E4ZYG3_9BURK|nr:ParA family protein [Pandoraea captiosa]VVE65000.1 chromosome partitioning protein ParA [Pandoraea captiosa]